MVLGTAWLNPSYVKVKYPLISLWGVQELLPRPFFFFFLNMYVCESMYVVGIFSCMFADEPFPCQGADRDAAIYWEQIGVIFLYHFQVCNRKDPNWNKGIGRISLLNAPFLHRMVSGVVLIFTTWFHNFGCKREEWDERKGWAGAAVGGLGRRKEKENHSPIWSWDLRKMPTPFPSPKVDSVAIPKPWTG